MKHLDIVLLLMISSVIVSCGGKGQDKAGNKPKPVTVDVLIAANAELPSGIEVIGTVLSQEWAELHPEMNGRVTYLNMPDGAKVKAGTVLARINDAELQAQLQQQKVQLELAKKTEQRLQKLLAVNGVSQAEYDAALTELNLINANISVIQAQIEKTVVRAPFSGQLGLRQISLGAYVTTSSLIGTINQTDRVKVDFNVPESYKELVAPGKIVALHVQGSDEQLSAVITAVEPQINTSTRNLKVRAQLEKSALNPGAFVKVMLDNRIKGIVVPTNAIIPDARSNQVVVLNKGKAEFRNVETGIRTEDLVEITNGLAIGDSIVISGTLFVRPKSDVVVRSVKKIDELIQGTKK